MFTLLRMVGISHSFKNEFSLVDASNLFQTASLSVQYLDALHTFTIYNFLQYKMCSYCAWTWSANSMSKNAITKAVVNMVKFIWLNQDIFADEIHYTAKKTCSNDITFITQSFLYSSIPSQIIILRSYWVFICPAITTITNSTHLLRLHHAIWSQSSIVVCGWTIRYITNECKQPVSYSVQYNANHVLLSKHATS